ncbi:hypothetical protein LCGC14_2218370 [marine sediment metagenome]|uniref:Uncharacterized protein n=1 Tax=marine sediment metagenome TaxID=412755 RepID=A0A0F9FPA1_9ZZZZ
MARSNVRVLWVLAAGMSAAGCKLQIPLRPPLPPPVEGAVALTPLTRPKDTDLTHRMLLVRYRLITLELPIGSVSESEEIWSYLNEEPVGARIGTALAYNGLRVGMGNRSVWPDIAQVLRRLAGWQLRRSSAVARPGVPLPVTVKRGVGKQTLFLFRPDGTLVGQDYPPGDNVLMLTAGIDRENPSSVRLTCTPLIRAQRRRPRYVRAGGGYTLAAGTDHFALRDMDFAFVLAPGAFLVIGPGPDVRRESSPGHCFLVRRRKGVPFETVLVVAPEVFLAPVTKMR